MPTGPRPQRRIPGDENLGIDLGVPFPNIPYISPGASSSPHAVGPFVFPSDQGWDPISRYHEGQHTRTWGLAGEKPVYQAEVQKFKPSQYKSREEYNQSRAGAGQTPLTEAEWRAQGGVPSPTRPGWDENGRWVGLHPQNQPVATPQPPPAPTGHVILPGEEGGGQITYQHTPDVMPLSHEPRVMHPSDQGGFSGPGATPEPTGYRFKIPTLPPQTPDVLPSKPLVLTVPSTQNQPAPIHIGPNHPPPPPGPANVVHNNLTGSGLTPEENRISRSNNFNMRDLFGGYYGNGGAGGGGGDWNNQFGGGI